MINAIEQAIRYIQSHPYPSEVREVRYAEATGGPVEVNWSGMDMLPSSTPCHKIGTITCGELAQRLAQELQRMHDVEKLKKEKWGRRLDALCEAKTMMALINAKAQEPAIRRLIERMDDAILGIIRDIKCPNATDHAR
jgi:hypothetical protein